MRELLVDLPKAELHLHIEGTLEPDLAFSMARRNHVDLPHEDEEALRAAYVFDDLQSFLDVYYAACSVLVTERDFYDLTWAYLLRAAGQGVRHAEIFFDPQTHTDRGVEMATVVEGITRALEDGERNLRVTSRLIMCFLRHLSTQSAMATLEAGLPHRDAIVAVGLDSGEAGNRPRSSAPSSTEPGPRASSPSRTRARRDHPSTSGRHSTCSACAASTTACGAPKTTGSSSCWSRSRCR